MQARWLGSNLHPLAAKMTSADYLANPMRKQVLLQVLRGMADANIRFDDLRSLLTTLGFVERIKGSHHIFTKPEVTEILNIQPKGSHATPYQVKQVRRIITRYRLGEGIE